VQIEELLTGIDVVELRGDRKVDVVDLTHDSRRVRPGACFACVVGARTDGHVHAPEAVAAGAVALLVERSLDLGVVEAEVRDVRVALGPAASNLHGHPSRAMRCLGVTGTNGKTTTTYLLESIARAAGERVGLVGTTGARVDGAAVALDHTTPEATDLQALLAEMRDTGVDTVAMEVSSHALAQHRIDGTWFACAGFTNLSHDHLDYHGSVDAYFAAKASLFEPERAAAAAINLDDEFGAELARQTRRNGMPTITFALDDKFADIGADDIALEASGASFTVHDRRDNSSALVHSSLPGMFNIANALAAAAMSLASGIDFDAVATGLDASILVPGRLERIDAGQPFTVFVDYAHAPAALTSALLAARDLARDHAVIVVFGCGGDRDRDKRPVMGRAAGDGADFVILTSDNPRSESADAIAAEVLVGLEAGSAPFVVEQDRRAAIGIALDRARPGDVVLVAGKGHETGQTAGGVTTPFDDRLVASEELAARHRVGDAT
jgi:UDP-N-acetylmuramoyl-L-alanyl-D-glutamate--2,6-diaminopimelate ligase